MTTLKSNVIRTGAPIGAARAAVVLVHGRGASAESMLGLANAFATSDITYVAPQAPSGSWYPYSFMAPFARNEPHLGHALSLLSDVVDDLRPSASRFWDFPKGPAWLWSSRHAMRGATAESRRSAVH